MAADFRRALALLHGPENEWNRIVADPSAHRTLRPTQAALLGAATVAALVGYVFLRPAGTAAFFIPLYAVLFAAGRLLAIFAAERLLRAGGEVLPERAALLAGWGAMPVLLAGILEILPIPFLRWLWVLAGLGLAYMNLATAMTPVLGTSSQRGAKLSLRASAALALPIVAFDILRTLCP